MPMKGENCRRGARLVAATVLAGVLLAGTAWAAPEAGFLHIRTNLSGTPGYMSAYPDLAVSADGNRVAVAWVDGYNRDAGYKGHVYLRAASETDGWGDKVQVFAGSSSACAYLRASVAITGTTAHLAYVVFENTCMSPQNTRVCYRACSLLDGSCGTPEEVASASSQSGYQITWADLALDATGNPRVVWARYYSNVSNIFYKARADGWPSGDGTLVDVSSNRKNNTPAIAWGDNYAHIVWENETDGGIGYRRCNATGCEEAPVYLYKYSSYPPHNPDVAAGAGRVFVVWDVLAQSPNEYFLLYRRSNDGGGNFNSWREVGTDEEAWSSLRPYSSNTTGFLSYLRPAIALDAGGWPTVVWHAADSGDSYVVYYTSAVSGTEATVSWNTPAPLRLGQAGAATVGVGEPSGERHLHVAYMEGASVGDREVYYDSNESDRYKHIYLPLVLKDASSE